MSLENTTVHVFSNGAAIISVNRSEMYEHVAKTMEVIDPDKTAPIIVFFGNVDVVVYNVPLGDFAQREAKP